MNPQQVAHAGEMFVAAEIHRRGGYAVTFAGNMPGIDILASDLADTRRISIQVKTKSSGSWHARFPEDAAECSEDPAETSFWVFADLGDEHPAYFIAQGGGCATTSGKTTPHTSLVSRKSTGHGSAGTGKRRQWAGMRSSSAWCIQGHDRSGSRPSSGCRHQSPLAPPGSSSRYTSPLPSGSAKKNIGG